MYKVRIDTSSFHPLIEVSEKACCINALMKSLNGWMSLEQTLMEVRWRISEFLGIIADGEGSYEWRRWKNRPENTVSFRYKSGRETMTRIADITGAGSKRAIVSVDSLIDTLCAKEKLIIPFSLMYDGRGAINSRCNGCYMEITNMRKEFDMNEWKPDPQINMSAKIVLLDEHETLLKKLKHAEAEFSKDDKNAYKRAVFEFYGGRYNELIRVAALLGAEIEDAEKRYLREGREE